MSKEIITTLHPDGDPDVSLYPNIKKDNIPDESIDEHKISNDSVGLEKLKKDVLDYIDEQGKPTQEQVDDWLDNHPEATTTVEDGSITKAKLDSILTDDIDFLENTKNIIKYNLTFTNGYYVNNAGSWRTSSLFGLCVVDVRYVKKLLYITDTLNQYLCNVAFSYDKEMNSDIIDYEYYDSLGYKIIDVPAGANYAFITKPVDTNGNVGNTSVYLYLDFDKLNYVLNFSYIESILDNEQHKYVTDTTWVEGSLFGTFGYINLNNAKQIKYINRVNNVYIKQIIFTKENNYNSANIISSTTYGKGEHIIDVPAGAKYVYIATPYDANGNRGANPSLYLPINSVISANEKNEVYALPSEIISEPYTALNIYIKNFSNNKNDMSLNLEISTAVDRSKQYSNRIIFNSISATNLLYSVNYYKNNVLEKTKNITIKYKNLTKSNKKVLVIGDSTIAGVGATNDGAETNYMLNIFANASATLTLIGTMGSESNKYEGRSGWSIYNYLTTNENNPFYNPNTNDFDFDYYLTNNELDTPDYVVIQLGINDMFFGNDRIDSVISSAYNNLIYMINKILNYNSTIKVLYNLVITPKDDQDTFAEDYGIGVKAFQCKYNFLKFNEYVINNLENDINDDRLILVPTNLITDSSDMYNSVHPNDSGYEKIAKIVCTYLWNN